VARRSGNRTGQAGWRGDRELSFAGRVAIVTGAASGIGAATALLMATHGASVLLADNRSDELADRVEEFASQRLSVAGCVADLRDVAECAAMVRQAVDRFHRLDVLVNNGAVGTMVVGGTVETIEPEVWDLALEVNLRGAYAVSRAAVPHMRAGGRGGSIVNISSSGSLRSDARRPSHAYVSSKGGLIALTRAMAVSYGPDRIRVNAVLPGITRTRLTTDIVGNAERATSEGRGLPIGRVGEPEDIAWSTLFLASDAASFITGASLLVDGGASVLAAL